MMLWNDCTKWRHSICTAAGLAWCALLLAAAQQRRLRRARRSSDSADDGRTPQRNPSSALLHFESMEEANLTSAIARASTYLRGRVLSSNCLETAAAVRTGTANGDAYADGDVNDELTLGISALLALARPMEEQVGACAHVVGLVEGTDHLRLLLATSNCHVAGDRR